MGEGSTASPFVFPFGRRANPTRPIADGPRDVFVLGAYPSALHVHWKPPPSSHKRGITALAVDAEPEPFWDGRDAARLVDLWKEQVDFSEETDGTATPAVANGDSGRALDGSYLEPMGLDRSACWITDCLDTYRLSKDGRKAIDQRFLGWADADGVTQPHLAPHPTDQAIFREALAEHRDRLTAELDRARPEQIVTLGNAALRVLTALLGVEGAPSSIEAENYGRPLEAELRGRGVEWLALAHPGAINRSAKWRKTHRQWASLRRHVVDRGGRLYQRVAVSGATPAWPPATPRHLVDAVHFPDHPDPGVFEWSDHEDQFAEDMNGYRARTSCSSATGRTGASRCCGSK